MVDGAHSNKKKCTHPRIRSIIFLPDFKVVQEVLRCDLVQENKVLDADLGLCRHYIQFCLVLYESILYSPTVVVCCSSSPNRTTDPSVPRTQRHLYKIPGDPLKISQTHQFCHMHEITLGFTGWTGLNETRMDTSTSVD